jgi:hypothetical protein
MLQVSMLTLKQKKNSCDFAMLMARKKKCVRRLLTDPTYILRVLPTLRRYRKVPPLLNREHLKIT